MSKNARFDCVIFEPNAVFFDMVFQGLTQLPVLGEEHFAKKLTIAPGGAFNTAAALSRLGLKVALVAQIGTDFFSRFIEDRLQQEGVETRYMMRRDGEARAITVSLTFPQDRAFVSYLDGKNRFDFPSELLDAKRTKLLFVPHLARDKAVRELMAKARQAGLKVAVDPHLPWGTLADAKLRQTLSLADLLLPNSREACLLTACQTVEEALPKLAPFCQVAIKDGPAGALGYRGGVTARVRSLKSKVLDTTGAGDNFNAGFLSGWLEGADLLECLARGNACGGLSVRTAGGAEGAPSRAEMEEAAAAILSSRKVAR